MEIWKERIETVKKETEGSGKIRRKNGRQVTKRQEETEGRKENQRTLVK